MPGIELKGFDEFFGRLQGASGRLERETDKAVQKTAAQIRSRTVDGISSQRWASKWPPLSEKYQLFKRANKGSDKVLISGIRGRVNRKGEFKGFKKVLPGNYRNSFEFQKIDNAKWAVGTAYPQARALEMGNPKKNMPARPHLGLALLESKDDFIKNVMDAIRNSL